MLKLFGVLGRHRDDGTVNVKLSDHGHAVLKFGAERVVGTLPQTE